MLTRGADFSFTAPGAPTPITLEFNISQPPIRTRSVNGGVTERPFDFHQYDNTWHTAYPQNLPQEAPAPLQPGERSFLASMIDDEIMDDITSLPRDFQHASRPLGRPCTPKRSSISGVSGHQSSHKSPFTVQRLMRTETPQYPLAIPSSTTANSTQDWNKMWYEPLSPLEEMEAEWDSAEEEQELEELREIALAVLPAADANYTAASQESIMSDGPSTESDDSELDDLEEVEALVQAPTPTREKILRRQNTPWQLPGQTLNRKRSSDTTMTGHQSTSISLSLSMISEADQGAPDSSQLTKRKLAAMLQAISADGSGQNADDGYETDLAGSSRVGPASRTRQSTPSSLKRRRTRLFDPTSTKDQAKHFCRWSDPVTGVRCGTGFFSSARLTQHLTDTHVQKELRYVEDSQIPLTGALALILVTYHRVMYQIQRRPNTSRHPSSEIFRQATFIKEAAMESGSIDWSKLVIFLDEVKNTAQDIRQRLTCSCCDKSFRTFAELKRHEHQCVSTSPSKSSIKKERRHQAKKAAVRWAK